MTAAPLVQLPWPLRQINLAGRGLEGLGVHALSLSETKLIAAARREAGLSDFGEDDGFRVALRRWIDAFEHEAQLSLFGRVVVRYEIIRCLVNRLRIQEQLRTNPKIRALPVSRPVFILGLPRTGTTILHRLMALAPRGRAPLMWELLRPAPSPRPETRDSDPRIARARRDVEQSKRLLPSMQAIHELDATAADECFYLFNNSFMSKVAEAQADVRGYMRWLMSADMVPAYRYYRTQLQILQAQIPTDYWILKTPTHLFALDALLEVFPDARIIQTHRDPSRVVASGCSLYETTRALFTESVQPHELGRGWLDSWSMAMDRALRVRDAVARPGQFYDLRYEDFVADPVAAVQGIHAAFGLEFTNAYAEAMRAHLRDSPKGKHGAHRYELSRYGLDRDEVRGRFARYVERFDV